MIINLLSDTVTKPTDKMRRAMAEAEVGDDVYRADPTINKLEEMAAERLGKEAALFVPTGTMGNLASILSHCHRGEEIIVGDNSHIFHYEAGGAAVAGGLIYHTVPNDRLGMISPQDVEQAVRGKDVHFAPTGLLCLENTHNRRGGTVLNKAQIDQLCSVAHKHGVPVHLDGARLFNAITYLGIEPAELVENLDSVQFCLSKGLAAPVGSMIVGTTDFIDRARGNRKMLGGGMRQAGVLAAAGIIALTEMSQRLDEDHYNARKFAESLNLIDGFEVDMETVQTNIVAANLTDKTFSADQWSAALKENGILVGAVHSRRMRFVFHYEIGRQEVERTLSTIAKLAA